jgi:hypothetical protein
MCPTTVFRDATKKLIPNSIRTPIDEPIYHLPQPPQQHYVFNTCILLAFPIKLFDLLVLSLDIITLLLQNMKLYIIQGLTPLSLPPNHPKAIFLTRNLIAANLLLYYLLRPSKLNLSSISALFAIVLTLTNYAIASGYVLDI